MSLSTTQLGCKRQTEGKWTSIYFPVHHHLHSIQDRPIMRPNEVAALSSRYYEGVRMPSKHLLYSESYLFLKGHCSMRQVWEKKQGCYICEPLQQGSPNPRPDGQMVACGKPLALIWPLASLHLALIRPPSVLQPASIPMRASSLLNRTQPELMHPEGVLRDSELEFRL